MLAALEDSEPRISPIVLVELQYLFEIKRVIQPSQVLFDQLESEIGLELCDHPYAKVAKTAVFETWTRDPFDRLIVAHARSNAYAPLITSDENPRELYPVDLVRHGVTDFRFCFPRYSSGDITKVKWHRQSVLR